MPDPFGWCFSQNLDYFTPYKNQLEPGYKGHTLEFMGFFKDHLGPFGTIEDHLRPYWTFWDHFLPFRTHGLIRKEEIYYSKINIYTVAWSLS